MSGDLSERVSFFACRCGPTRYIFSCLPVREGDPQFRLWEKGPMIRVEVDLDFIEELRLRRWARQNYVPPEQRDSSWHPVVLDEMDQKDVEVCEPAIATRA